MSCSKTQHIDTVEKMSLRKRNAGQLGLGSSWPESSGPGQVGLVPYLAWWECVNKKEFIQQKLEKGCLILRNIIVCDAYSICIPHQRHSIPVDARSNIHFLSSLMSVDIEYIF